LIIIIIMIIIIIIIIITIIIIIIMIIALFHEGKNTLSLKMTNLWPSIKILY